MKMLKKVIDLIKSLQPLIIGLLVLFIFLNYRREKRKFEEIDSTYYYYRDSLNRVNNELYTEIAKSENRVDSILKVNSQNKESIVRIESSIKIIDKKRKDEKNYINFISLDSNVIILSRNLSKKGSNK